MDVAEATGAAAPAGSSSPGSKSLHRRWASDTWTVQGTAGETLKNGNAGGYLEYDDIMSGLLDVDDLASEACKSAEAPDAGPKLKSEDGDVMDGANDVVGEMAEGADMIKEDDSRKTKRIMANRQSAQRSRMRKMQYTSELERSVQRLHTEINQLMPQVTLLKQKQTELTERNKGMRQRITELMQETQYKDHMNSALREEVQRIKREQEQSGQAQQPTTMPSLIGAASAQGVSLTSSATAGASRQAPGQLQQQPQIQHQPQPQIQIQQGQQVISLNGLGLENLSSNQILVTPQQQLGNNSNFLLLPQGQGQLIHPLPPGLAISHAGTTQAITSPTAAQAHAIAAAARPEALLSAAGIQTQPGMAGSQASASSQATTMSLSAAQPMQTSGTSIRPWP